MINYAGKGGAVDFKAHVTYDNRLSWPPTRGSGHLAFSIGRQRFLYCYIRKNACTLMKHVMMESIGITGFNSDERFPFERFSHRTRPLLPTGHDVTFFIYRDPIERIISLFNSKFVQRMGHADIAASYERVTGLHFEDSSFDSMVLSYMQSGQPLDPHLASQASHLASIRYTHAIKMRHLVDAMRDILGDGDLADRLFRRSWNMTSADRYNESSSNVCVRELYKRYLETGMIPSAGALLTDRTRAAILNQYDDDRRLLKRLTEGAAK